MGSQVRIRFDSKSAARKDPSIARVRPPGPAGKIYKSLSDTASGRHDLQYFEMFCNVSVGKISRFSGNINWVLKPALSATVLPMDRAK